MFAGERSSVTAVLVVAAWLTAFANLPLWRALAAILPPRQLVIAGVAIALVLFCSLVALLALLAWGRVTAKVLWLLVILAAAVSQYFMLAFGIVIDPVMLANVRQTGSSEALDLLKLPFFASVLTLTLPPLLWLAKTRLRAVSWPRQLLRNGGLGLGAAAIGAGVALAAYSVLGPLVRNHLELRYLPNPVTPLVSLAKAVARQPPSTAAPQRLGSAVTLGASHQRADAKPPLVVIVVGETARADHFGLNGYARDTTPELMKRNVLSFGNVWSCGTSTLHSVPCMFSPLGRERYLERSHEVENLLDVARDAGMAVLWIDNQAGCKNVCDRVASVSTSVIAKTPAGQSLCAGGECLDAALLLDLDARLAALPEAARRNGSLLVLHMMGSHGPAYSRRSPPATKRFRPECETLALGDCDHDALVNAYDNSIAYTDQVLAQLIDWLQAKAADRPAAMLYVSDHGESLGEFGIFLHGLPYSLAPDVQKHVPLVLWLNEPMQRQRSISLDCLRAGSGQRLSHDNLFHVGIGLLDVLGGGYDARLDFIAACGPPPGGARVSHSTR